MQPTSSQPKDGGLAFPTDGFKRSAHDAANRKGMSLLVCRLLVLCCALNIVAFVTTGNLLCGFLAALSSALLTGILRVKTAKEAA